jgi:hypothetical protein
VKKNHFKIGVFSKVSVNWPFGWVRLDSLLYGKTPVILTYDRIYFYIRTQKMKSPQSGLMVVNLLLLVLYLMSMGFFMSLFALQWSLPSMVRLGDYATHDADTKGRVLAIAGVVLIWSFCIAWVFILPLIPVVGGVIARKAS